MKYGSIYSKDNIENKYNYSSTGGRRSSQNNFETSHDHHTHSTLNTDGLLRSSSGTGYHSSGSSIKNSGKPSTKKSSSQNKPDTKSQKRQTSGGRALTYHERKKKKKRGCFPFLLLIILLIAGAVFAFRFSLKGAFSKIEKYPLDKTSVTVNDTDANIKDYQNIALFGVDSQDNKIKDKGSRTDCIIIASINKSTKKVKLMSIYRRTINRNLDLNITDFATVNFKALADAVDVLGGIPLTINSEKELQNLNDYIGNMNHINGGNSPKFEKTGTYTFDGNQAVAYSRIRYMEGGDHARANHQRLVLEGIMNTAKKQPLKLGKLISTVLPQCKTSLSNDDLTKLTLSMARCKIEDSQAYPFKSEDERYNGIYYGFPITAQTNVKKAHEYLFGTKDYKPTEELQKISAKIKVVTDYIGITE